MSISAIKEQADLLLDSSNQSLHELSETVRMRVEGRERRDLVMVFQSFGFKYGIPSDADYVFDVRFYPTLTGSQIYALSLDWMHRSNRFLKVTTMSLN